MNFTEMYLTILTGVLLADGVIKEKEKQFLETIIKDANKDIEDSIQEYIDGKKKITEDLIEKIAIESSKNVDVFLQIIRDSYIMAVIDRELHEKEVSFIKNFMSKIVSDNQKIEEIINWAKDSYELSKKGRSLSEQAFVDKK